MYKDFLINNKKLMEEWNWEKNNRIGIYPNNLTCGSSKKVWWKCKNCGYEWQTKISHRNSGTKCRNCNNKKLATATYESSLQSLFPHIAKEWNYKKNITTPNMIYPKSNKKYWWICNKGHEWQDTPSHRVERKNGCPFCSNHKVLTGFNDLQTTHPELINEWDFEQNNKLNIQPTLISAGSKKEVNWVCKKGHHWKAVVYSRTGNNKTGCPYCSKELRISYPEKIIAYYIKQQFQDLIENYKIDKKELDLFIPSLNIGIEYDGARWHNIIKKDLTKDLLCQNIGIELIRIRENGCPIYSSCSKKFYIKDKSIKELETAINFIFEIINKNFGKTLICDFNIERDSNAILQNLLTKEKNKSIANSNLINEWNWQKNKDINPSFISLYSNKKFWWICNKGHEWLSSVAHRTNGRNCPYCTGQKVLVNYNDLASQYPQISQEWDYSKNNKKPTEVNAQSNKKYWWICSKCNHSWFTSIYVRTIMNCGCPECKKKSISTHSSHKVLNIEKNITFKSIKDASTTLKINASAISNCCRGKTKTAGGYHWKYV